MKVLPTVTLLATAIVLSSAGLLAAAGERRSDQARVPLKLNSGDRVVFIGNTFADQLRRYGYLETLLVARHPDHKLTFRNLGWSGDTLSLQPRPLNFGSLDDHLAAQKADVIVACFGMNESFQGPETLGAFEQDWRDFLKHLRQQKYNGKTAPRLVMISPIAHEHLAGRLPDPSVHNKNLEQYTGVMGRIAREGQIPFIDLFHSTRELMESQPSQKLTHNGIHLNQYGYWAVSQLIAASLLPREQIERWRVEIDAAAKRVKPTGTRVSFVARDRRGVSFDVEDPVLPDPPPPENTVVHGHLIERQSKLVIKNLRPGEYTLSVGGQEIETAAEDEWAAGRVLDGTPAHRRVERLREAINRKNRLFFYRWRPSNTEYIFGRRTKPFGAVSFPPEMKRLDELIRERDQTIRTLACPLPRQRWTLSPSQR